MEADLELGRGLEVERELAGVLEALAAGTRLGATAAAWSA